MTLFLIAHKVRGERAMDIAEPMEMEDGDLWWIIPTSGHRAYPYWTMQMPSLTDEIGSPPTDLQDHYAVSEVKRTDAARSRTPAAPRLEDL